MRTFADASIFSYLSSESEEGKCPDPQHLMNRELFPFSPHKFIVKNNLFVSGTHPVHVYWTNRQMERRKKGFANLYIFSSAFQML